MNSVIYIIPNHLYILYQDKQVKRKRNPRVEKIIKTNLKEARESQKRIKIIENKRPLFGITFDNYC